MTGRKKTPKTNDDALSIEPHEDVIQTELNNESMVQIEDVRNDDLKIVFIPKNLHEHFECVVGKHVFLDKPWTTISHKKIIDHLQSHSAKSCFWPFRKKLRGIKSEHVLVGYKPYSNEEFLLCTTDKSKLYIEEKEIQSVRELKEKVELSLCRVPGHWNSRNSERDIEEIKSVQTREKITYKWKLPVDRVHAKPQFEDSNSKSAKNEYVKLEPRSKDVFESIDKQITDSSVQAVRKMVTTEMQTMPKIPNNKCIQSVATDEDMFQLKPLTEPNKALDDFLEKHVPNLVNQLHNNELYDLYRDDYKLLRTNKEIPIHQVSKVINYLPGFQNVSPKKYVSCHTWHPTIPGIFAICYMTNSNALYKSVNLDKSTTKNIKPTVTSAAEMSKSADKGDICSISFSDDENDHDSWDNNREANFKDEHYKEKLMSLLNKEFVQKMRVIQITENEKMVEVKDNENINKLLTPYNSIVSDKIVQSYLDKPINIGPSMSNQEIENVMIQNEQLDDELDNEILIDENVIIDEAQNDLMNAVEYMDEQNELNYLYEEFSIESNEYKTHNKEILQPTKSMISADAMDVEDKDLVDHHDSDTESFYNIWGVDEDWLYGNKLRNVVRHIHREFNRKYDREAKEEKFFNFLKAEAKYTRKKNNVGYMDTERRKLTKDMFEAGDMYQGLKNQQEFKSKKKLKSPFKSNKQYKALQNDEESMIKRENTPILEPQNNSVIIWSISDNIFPKLRLESPEEVCCVEFNLRNGDTVVGGLENGQICIWDIKGKLEEIDTKDISISEKEKMHHEHLSMQMKWSKDVNYKTRIKPAALSAILKSHESTVTAIQWIHPMNEITPRGKLINVQDEQFSDQFFSASMDGTIKLWDLHSKPMPKANHKTALPPRFGFPEKLKNYKSPLHIYNNCLKPTYTIIITEPEKAIHSPITALSFMIPLIQYNYTSNQPLVIGKRQFEFVPNVPHDPNRILVIGNIMGQFGVVTWDGYDPFQHGQNVEECKHIWWGQVHDGPINSIKRNPFNPEIHLVCGGHIVSIWSLDYSGGPIWWKRFKDFTNSILWSSKYPAEFQVSFNTSGILQFWNLMKYTHQPYHTEDIFLSDGLIASLSTPLPSIHYIGAERFRFAEGINEVMDQNKNELISFSDSAGTIMMVTIDVVAMKPKDMEDAENVFMNEVNLRKELDAWNEKYREQFGTMGENNVDDYKSTDRKPPTIEIESAPPTLTAEQIKRKLCDETFKWYFNKVKTRLGKMKEGYILREKRRMVEATIKKKNITESQLKAFYEELEGENNFENKLAKIKNEADETYVDIVNKLLAAEDIEEYVFDVDSKRSAESDILKITLDRIRQQLAVDIVAEKEMFSDYIKDNPYKAEQKEDWDKVIEFSEMEVRNRLNDPNLLKNPSLRMFRQDLAKKFKENDSKINERKSFKDKHACDDQDNMRQYKLNKLKAMYGKSYYPQGNKSHPSQKMPKAEDYDGDYEQLYDGYFEGESGDGNYSNYGSERYLMEMEYSSGSSYTQRTPSGLPKDNDAPIELIENEMSKIQSIDEYGEYHSSRQSQSDFDEGDQSSYEFNTDQNENVISEASSGK